MAKHIIAKGLDRIEQSASDIWQQTDAAFHDMEDAIASGSRTAQTKALATLRGLSEVSHNLIASARDHAMALMPEHVTARPVEDPALEAADAKVKARTTRTSVPQGE